MLKLLAVFALAFAFGQPQESVERRALSAPGPPLVAAAGDLVCSPSDPNYNGGAGTAQACAARRTSDLALAGGYDVVLALGDLQYPAGALSDFQTAYAPSWGRLFDITYPVVGNHEYATPGAAGYFDYFGDRAGDAGRGWYGFDLGRWHLVALNSNCEVVRCGARSPQARWLRRDLRRHPRRCVLAFFHHPRFASGPHGPDRRLEPLWRVLYRRDAELVLSGHDHLYERFEPQTARGRIDRQRGIVQFVAGTGGKSLYYFRNRQPNAAARHRVFGLLRLALARGRYRWAFLRAPGGEVLDRGTRRCH